MHREAARPLPSLLERALSYWDGKRQGRRMPSRRDIDPAEIPQLLPHLLLVDVQRDPLDFRYRLVGTAVTARFGRDDTGARFSALAHLAPGSPAWKAAVRVLEEKRPIVTDLVHVGTSRWVTDYRDLSLPLSEDDETVNMILAVLQFATR
jgi:hypothetical protein